ncbi:hypothetical protein J6590_106382, partial [Homalodisca vitripennis]
IVTPTNLFAHVALHEQGPQWLAPDLCRSDPSAKQIHKAPAKEVRGLPLTLALPRSTLTVLINIQRPSFGKKNIGGKG